MRWKKQLYYSYFPSFSELLRGAVSPYKLSGQVPHSKWTHLLGDSYESSQLVTKPGHCGNTPCRFFLASISFFFPTLIPLDPHLPCKGTTLSSLPQVLLSRGPKLRKYFIISRVTIKITKIRVYNFPTSWGKTKNSRKQSIQKRQIREKIKMEKLKQHTMRW